MTDINISNCHRNMVELNEHKLAIGGNSMLTIIDIDTLMIEKKIINYDFHIQSLLRLRNDSILFHHKNGFCVYNLQMDNLSFSQIMKPYSSSLLLTINENKFISITSQNEIKVFEY